MHLIDIENLCGGAGVSGEQARATIDQYLALARWQSGDLVVIAAHPSLGRQIAWDPPVEWRLHTAYGTDGADLALLTHAAPEFVARRVQRLVIGSGDHAFIPRARAARDLGVGVMIVSRADALCRGWVRHGFPVAHLRDAVTAPTTVAA